MIKIAYYRVVSKRRRYLRVPLRVRVTNRQTDMFEHFSSTNISAGGMYLRADSPLAVGTPLKLEFQLPSSEKLLILKAKVMRNMLSDSKHSAGMGIKFTAIDPSDLEIIEKFINEG